MWRDGRRAMLQWKEEGGTDGTFAVCRHCSGIFQLIRVGSYFQWRQPEPKHLAVVLSELLPVAMKFAAIRGFEEASPGWLDRKEAADAIRVKREPRH